jgi:hypothetical protein
MFPMEARLADQSLLAKDFKLGSKNTWQLVSGIRENEGCHSLLEVIFESLQHSQNML